MSIKILDTIQPAGKFAVTDAANVAYTSDTSVKNAIDELYEGSGYASNIEYESGKDLYSVVKSIEDTLKEVNDTLNAEPTIGYSNKADDTTFFPSKAVELGENIFIEFYIDTRSVGQCRVVISRSAKDDNNFVTVKELKVDPGYNNINVGTAVNVADYKYRVRVVDALNKPAKFKVPSDFIDEVGEELDYLDFRVICGGLQFSSSFSVENASTIFGVQDTEIAYPYTFNYAVTGYRYLLYKVVADGAQAPSIADMQPILLSDTPITGGSTISERKTLTFSSAPFSAAGAYKLYVAAAVSDSDYETNFDSTNKAVTVSQIIVDTLEVLEANSIAVTVITDDVGTFTSESFIRINFVPKTNIAAAVGYKQIRVNCRAFRKADTDVTYAELSDYSTAIQCSHSIMSTWDLGRLPVGEYKFVLQAYAIGVNSEATETYIVVSQAAEEGSSCVQDNLLFSFDATPQSFTADRNVWKASFSANDKDFKIVFKNLNPSIGLTTTDIKGETTSIVKLRGDAFGVLYNDNVLYNPWAELASTYGDNIQNGFTLETYMRSKCVGNLAAKLLSMRNDFLQDSVASPGVSIGFDSARVDTAKGFSEYTLLEDTWQHVALVIDRESRIDPANIEDINPYATARLYIDGTLVVATPIDNADQILTDELYPFILNGSANRSILSINENSAGVLTGDMISNSGEGSIKLLRCYTRGLMASEIYQNYLNTLLLQQRAIVIGRNGKTLPAIYFTKNLFDDNAHDDIIKTNYYNDEGLINSTFNILHTIKVKKADAKNPYGSKSTLVNCTMHYYLNDEWKHEPDVDVYLQGTSSLEYPVKNYQIKIFETVEDIVDGEAVKIRKPKKIYPPFKDDSHGWLPDSIFTLKCDYMEQSHRNNTPTASYYQDKVLDAVITQMHPTDMTVETKRKYYSPAKQQNLQISADGVVSSKYRDAIDGYACVVYYSDNNVDNVGNNKNKLKENGEYIVTAEDCYAGSYMFNIDKIGTQLGFKISVDEALNSGTIEESETVIENGQRCIPIKLADGTDTGIRRSTLPCISYEGATNDDNSAAAFIPYEEHYKEHLLSEWEKHGPTFKLSIDESLRTYESFEDFYTSAKDGLVSGIETESQHYNALGDKIKYLEATLEPRFTYTDDDELDNKLHKTEYKDNFDELTYNQLIKTIRWVYDNCSDEKNFRKDFEKYFSLEYCIAYYLQMMVFTQVDNAGKNAMFDTWNGKLYPRPYDMDTQMGLDNSGQDIKLPSAELNIDLCPAVVTGSNVATGIYGEENSSVNTWSTTTSKTHIRFNSYNTKESRLWKAFGRFYRKEIADVYAALRSTGVYSVEGVCTYVDNMTCDAIGEKFYNKDAAQKYFTYKSTDPKTQTIGFDSTYLKCIQGSRKNRYRQFLTERLCFLDTFFSYNSSTNETIELRANANSTSSPVGIHVYSPQYIRIAVDSAKQADIIAYADPNDTYTYNNVEYKGTLFTIPTTGTDKNIVIYGAGNIRAINHTDDLNLTKFQISKAIKLTDINLSGANSLTELILGNNSYMRNIDISGTTALKASIDLSNCENLDSVNANNSAITGLALPAGSNLRKLNLKKSNITSLSLEQLALLDNNSLQLDGCNYLTELKLIDLPSLKSPYEVFESDTSEEPKLVNFPFNNLTRLSKLIISGCDNLTTVDLSGLSSLNGELSLSGNIKTLNLSNCAGNCFKNLNLTAITNLRNLNLSGLTVNGTTTIGANIILPSGEDVPKLSRLDLQSATVSTIGASTLTEDGIYDFSGIKFEESKNQVLTLRDNHSVKKILNLTYTGNLYYLFGGASYLTALEKCSIASMTTNCGYMFYTCNRLRDIGNTSNWDLTNCTTANAVFHGCSCVNYASFTSFLELLKNATDIVDFISGAYLYTADGKAIGDSDEYPSTLGNVFENNKKLTNVNNCFYYTGFKQVAPGLLDVVSEKLEKANKLFGHCAGMTYVPANIFKNCSALKEAQEAFVNDQKLGETTTYTWKETDENGVEITKEEPCILYKSYDVFYSKEDENDNSIRKNDYLTNIKGLFINCKKLQIAKENEHDDTTLKDFFKPLIKLNDASMCFANCTTITDLPDGLLATNTDLTNIDLMFYNTGIKQLPNSIFHNTYSNGAYTAVLPPKSTHGKLLTARGLFANCRDLKGVIHKNFFKMTPNITRIGSCPHMTNSYMSHTYYIVAPGMFANTGITGFHADFLQPLTALTDCSMLFFNGSSNVASGVVAGSATGVSFEPVETAEDNSFYVYSGELLDCDASNYADNCTSITTVLPSSLLEKNSELEDTSYMFAGRAQLEGVADDLLEKNTRLSSTAGMFMRCCKIAGVDINKLIQGHSDLKNISYMFSHCKLVSSVLDNIFSGCVSIANCKAAFRNSGITGGIPASLFNDCRTTLTDVSYMFAECAGLNDVISTGYALINDPAQLEELYKNYLSGYYYAKCAVDSVFMQTYTDYTAFENKVFSLEDNYECDDFYSHDNYLAMNTKIDIQQKGLLSDCTNLVNVEYMFSGCRNIVGPIPADMLYFSGGRKNTNITSIAGLFEDCWKLTLNSATAKSTKTLFDRSSTIAYRDSADSSEIKRQHTFGGGCYSKVYPVVRVSYADPLDNDSTTSIIPDTSNARADHFIPEDWLSALTNLQNISRCFYNVGTIRNDNNDLVGTASNNNYAFTYSYLKLPDKVFQSQAAISDASYAFAFCTSLGASELTANFMKNSLTALTNISGIFIESKLKSIGTETSRIFESSYLNTKLNKISHAFYNTNGISLLGDWFYSSSDAEENEVALLSTGMQDSFAPRFYDRSKFSNIDTITAQGTFYNTKVSPYYIISNNSYEVNSNYSSSFTSSTQTYIYSVPTYPAKLDKVTI